MAKYTPLEIYLRKRLGRESEITLDFEAIESIIDGKLPNSAFRYQAWWAHEKNPHQPHKNAWQNAGWKVDSYDLRRRKVRFVHL